jgi:hypothetical protein
LLSIPFNVRSVNGEVADALGWHLEPFKRPRLQHEALPLFVFVEERYQGEPSPPLTYLRSGASAFRNTYPAAVLNYALWDIQAHVSQNTRDFLTIHAGAVAGPRGAVLLPAEPEGGKSSLVAALLREGFDYLSDELGVIDPVTTRAYAYPKRITLKGESLSHFDGLEERLEDRKGLNALLHDRFVRPEDLGAAVAKATAIQAVVFPSPDRAGSPKLRPIPKAEAVERATANSFNLQRYEERGMVLLSRVMKGAETFLLEGGSVKDRASAIADHLLD